MSAASKKDAYDLGNYAADITNQGWGLGCVASLTAPDPKYGFSQVLPKEPPRPLPFARQYYVEQPVFAGPAPTTVACAWRNWLTARPQATYMGPTSLQLHRMCKAIDGLPAPIRGTTIMAGAQVLYNEGYIGNYYWADAEQASDVVEQIRYWCLHFRSALVVGSPVYTGFCEPTFADKRWWAEIRGRVEGRAAYLLTDWSDSVGPEGAAKILCWSPTWGRQGYVYIRRHSLARLISEGGEVCGVLDKLVGARAATRKFSRQPVYRPDLALPVEPVVDASPFNKVPGVNRPANEWSKHRDGD